MPDTIFIRDLLVRTILGINPDERENRQDVLINVRLHTDTRPAARTDDIRDAVNYRTIAKQIIDLAESSRFFLVETLAERIAELCLQDARVRSVWVRVEKPMALRFARGVGAEIHRERP
ncbi:MAG: dihydroneopterin aldolase [Planctomycetota bacterium]|nr:MAG: dihydroneopterin aldolase [Planctomycetota bacterium]